MNEASLPSPDIGSIGYHLRRVAVKAIQSLDMVAPRYPNGAHPGAAKLAAFFDACRLATLTIGKATPVLALTPATSTGIVGSTQQLTLDKGGSSGTVTYVSANPAIATVNSSGLVTRVAEGTTTITANVAEGTSHKARSIAATIVVTAE